MPVAVPLLPPPPPPIPVGSGRDIFIFRPAEPLPSGNVYNSWPALVAAAATVLGPKIVYFDNTLAACSIPPGTWDFASPTAFVGTGTLLSRVITPTPLAIPDGVKLPNVFTFSDLDVTSFTTTSVIDVLPRLQITPAFMLVSGDSATNAIFTYSVTNVKFNGATV